jgi:hypothetical protein
VPSIYTTHGSQQGYGNIQLCSQSFALWDGPRKSRRACPPNYNGGHWLVQGEGRALIRANSIDAYQRGWLRCPRGKAFASAARRALGSSYGARTWMMPEVVN